jgi:hypothetical protein
MKNKILAGFIIITTMLVSPAISQQIVSVTPDRGFIGEQAYPVIIFGPDAGLLTGFDYIRFSDPDITVVSAVPADDSRLEVILNIQENAQPNSSSDITVYLINGTVITKENAFTAELAGDFEVMLTVIPADPLYLSSFDPDNPQNSPLLFTVQILNNWKDLTDEVVVKFTVRKDESIELGYANKNYENGILNGESPLFDNREFDEYNVNSDAVDLLEDALQTGMLPPGVYNYYVEVFYQGSSIGYDKGVNVVTNLLTSIDLIGPGNTLDQTPETVFASNPYFQWFSAASSYDFALYEVMEGQLSPDEITSNLPEFEAMALGVTELIYPTYAEILEPGKTYAWQVKANFEGSMGQETVYSDVYWFQFEQGTGFVLNHIEITPQELTLNVNEPYQFHATGFDTNNDTVAVNFTWQVIPSSAGIIDENGLFIAGDTPGVVAILAKYNGNQEYSTVNLIWNGLDNNYFEFFIKKVFGLPAN